MEQPHSTQQIRLSIQQKLFFFIKNVILVTGNIFSRLWAHFFIKRLVETVFASRSDQFILAERIAFPIQWKPLFSKMSSFWLVKTVFPSRGSNFSIEKPHSVQLKRLFRLAGLNGFDQKKRFSCQVKKVFYNNSFMLATEIAFTI